MSVQWVRQEDAYGCVIACLSMIVGRTYADVKAELQCYPAAQGRDFNAEGFNFFEADAYLAEQGYAIARKYRNYLKQPRDVWPPAPWSDLHISDVIVFEGASMSHAVVVLADGSVLDPLCSERKRLTDYFKVHNVAAVTKYC